MAVAIEKANVTRFQKWGQFPEYAKWLHDNGLHLILIFDPAIEVDYDTFQRGLDKVSFVLRQDNR